MAFNVGFGADDGAAKVLKPVMSALGLILPLGPSTGPPGVELATLAVVARRTDQFAVAFLLETLIQRIAVSRAAIHHLLGTISSNGRLLSIGSSRITSCGIALLA